MRSDIGGATWPIKAVESAALASREAAFASVPVDAMHPASDESVPSQPSSATNVRSALNAALKTLLTHCPDVMILGEDLHEPYGGAFKVTAGLSEQFAGRVISTPISEAGITGAGIGLALAGRRPIVEIMFADFVTLSWTSSTTMQWGSGMFKVANCLWWCAPCGGQRSYGLRTVRVRRICWCLFPA